MAQPALSSLMADDPTVPEEATERIWTAVTPSLAKAIDDYYHENRFRTRSAAVRQLIEFGLKTAPWRGKALT